jgi:hypothetical protein
MPISTSIPPSGPARNGSRFTRFGSAIGLAAIAAVLCVLPATLRVCAAVGPVETIPRVSIALAAAALLPMVVSILVLRGAREGLRAFAGPEMGVRSFGAGLWVTSLIVTFSVFGGVLRATTHHHALAGVTFAFGALALAVGSALVCARVVVILRLASPLVRWALAGALAGLAMVALAWVGFRFMRATAHDPASASAAAIVVDTLAFTLAAGFAAQPSFALRRPLALSGPPVAVVIAILGIAALHDPRLRAAIDDHAPAFSTAAWWIPGEGSE